MMRQETEIEEIQMENEEVKLSLFAKYDSTHNIPLKILHKELRLIQIQQYNKIENPH